MKRIKKITNDMNRFNRLNVEDIPAVLNYIEDIENEVVGLKNLNEMLQGKIDKAGEILS